MEMRINKYRETNECKSIDVTIEKDVLYVDFLDNQYCSDLGVEILMTFIYENKSQDNVYKVVENIKKQFGENIIFDK